MPDVESGALPPAGGHYRHVVRAGDLLFVAGQVGWDAERRFADDVASQTRQALANVSAVLASEGATLDDLCAVTAYLADVRRDFPAYDAAYREIVPTDPPTRATVGVTLAEGCLVEISGIAVAPRR